jgi:tetratricopeptide (TPR) repeat protein
METNTILPPTKSMIDQYSKSIRESNTVIPHCTDNYTHVSWILHEATKYMPLFKPDPIKDDLNKSTKGPIKDDPNKSTKGPINKPTITPKIPSKKQTAKGQTKEKTEKATEPVVKTQAQIDQSLSERNDALIESVSLSFWQGRHFCKGIRYLQAAMYSKRKQEEQKKTNTLPAPAAVSTSATTGPAGAATGSTGATTGSAGAAAGSAGAAAGSAGAATGSTTESNHDAFTFLRHARVTFKKLSLYSPIAQLLNIESTLFLAAEAAMNNYKDKVIQIDKEAMEVLKRFYPGGRPLNYLCYSDGIARAFNNIGNVFENQLGDLKTAYERKKQSLECFKLFYWFLKNNRNRDNMVIASVSTNLGLMLLDVINASPVTPSPPITPATSDTANSSTGPATQTPNPESHKDALQLMRDGVFMMKRFFEEKQKMEERKAARENRLPNPIITEDEKERFASALNSLGGCLQQTHVTTSDQIEEEAIPFLRDALAIRDKLWKKEFSTAQNSFPDNEEMLNFTISSSNIVPKLIASYTNLGNALGFTANHRGEGIELLRKAFDLAQETSIACENLLSKRERQPERNWSEPIYIINQSFISNEQYRGHLQRFAMACANLGSALMEVPACQVESQIHVKQAIDIYEKLISTFPSPTIPPVARAAPSAVNPTVKQEVRKNNAKPSAFKVTSTKSNKTEQIVTVPAPLPTPPPVNPEKIRLMESRAVSILNLGLIAEKLDRNFDRALELKKQALKLRFECFVSRTHQDHKLPGLSTENFDIDKMIIENDNDKNIIITDAAIAANLCNVGESLAFHPRNKGDVERSIVYLRKSIEILDRIASHNCNKLLAVSSLLPHLEPEEAEKIALANLPLFDCYLQTAATFHRVDIAKAFANALEKHPEHFGRINLIKMAASLAREVENKRIAEATQEMNRKKFIKRIQEDKKFEKPQDDDVATQHGEVAVESDSDDTISDISTAGEAQDELDDTEADEVINDE